MNEMLKKTVVSGLGFASLAQDAIRGTIKDLVKQSKLSEEEGRRVLQDIRHRSKKAQKVLERRLDEVVRKAVKRLSAEPSSRAKAPKANGRGNSHRRVQHTMRHATAR